MSLATVAQTPPRVRGSRLQQVAGLSSAMPSLSPYPPPRQVSTPLPLASVFFKNSLDKNQLLHFYDNTFHQCHWWTTSAEELFRRLVIIILSKVNVNIFENRLQDLFAIWRVNDFLFPLSMCTRIEIIEYKICAREDVDSDNWTHHNKKYIMV